MINNLLLGFILGAVIFSIIIFALSRLFAFKSAKKSLERWKEEELKKEVSKALEIQRPVIKGKISEQLFPLLYQRFGNLSDFHFIGNPVDYVIFEGLSDFREGKNVQVSVKFVEVKTGSSGLSRAEEGVKSAINQKRVSWEEFRIGNEEKDEDRKRVN